MRKAIIAVLVLLAASTAYTDSIEEIFQAPADRAYAATLAAVAGEWRVVSTDAVSRTVSFYVGRGFGRDPQDGTVVITPTGDQSCRVVVSTQGAKGGSVWGAGGGKVRRKAMDMIRVALASGAASPVSDSLVGTYAVIGVFVRGADGGSAFLEPAVADSIEDLRDQLKGKKTLRVVEDAGAADVIVEVLGRGWEATGSSTTEVKSTLNTDWSGKPVVEQSATSEADTAMVLRAQLIVGDYSLKMAGRHGARWKGAAGHLAGKIDAWIEQNRAQLLERRRTPNVTVGSPGVGGASAPTPDQSIPLPVTVASAPEAHGTFMIESTPAGAEVYIDGDFFGSTPMEHSLSAGKHEIELRKKGHAPWKRQLTVNAGARAKIAAELEPQR